MGKWSFKEEHDIIMAHYARMAEERKAKEETESEDNWCWPCGEYHESSHPHLLEVNP
jgi:hypothetical protein